MDYSFIRKIVNDIPSVDAKGIYETCLSNGIEVFVRKDNEYHNMSLEDLSENIDMYVSAADFEYVKTLVTELGMKEFLCTDSESASAVVKSEVELAEEEFYRKHKQNQMFAWAVIILVILFMIFQFMNA